MCDTVAVFVGATDYRVGSCCSGDSLIKIYYFSNKRAELVVMIQDKFNATIIEVLMSSRGY